MKKLLFVLIIGIILSNSIYSQKSSLDYSFINSIYKDFIKKDSKIYYLDFRPSKLLFNRSQIDTISKYLDFRKFNQLDSIETTFTWIDSLLINAVIIKDSDIAKFKSGYYPRLGKSSKSKDSYVFANNDSIKLLNEERQYYCLSKPIFSINEDYAIIKVSENYLYSNSNSILLFTYKNDKWVCIALVDFEEQVVIKG